MQEYRLEMRGVCKSFPGVKALDHAQLRLRPGTVHALMGENGAGKSTLMKCMFGIYEMDEGEVIFEGKPVKLSGPLEALEMGIAMVHQELQPIPARTVGENIFLGRYPMKKLFGIIPMVDHEKMYADTAELLKKVRMDFDPKQMLGELSVSQMQSVEIAKAVSANCKVLILDEPTSSLTSNEVEALFRIIEDLKAEGVAIVYISHKMDEILRISDEVTIMRDGQYIGTWDCAGLTTDFIISKMVGRELTNLFPERHNIPGEVVFEVENFTSINPKSFRNVNFQLRKGEILGVGGLVGAVRVEGTHTGKAPLPRRHGTGDELVDAVHLLGGGGHRLDDKMIHTGGNLLIQQGLHRAVVHRRDAVKGVGAGHRLGGDGGGIDVAVGVHYFILSDHLASPALIHSSPSSRILYLRILPAAFMGNFSTKSM